MKPTEIVCINAAKVIAYFNKYLFKKINLFIPGTGLLLRKINNDFIFTYNGYSMLFRSSMASVYGFMIIDKSNEQETLDYLNEYAKKQENYTFINIGSCVGEFVFTKVMHNSNITIAIDANINAVEVLKENLKLNQISKVVVYNNIVCDEPGIEHYYFRDNKNPNESSIIPKMGSNENITKLKIETINLDNISDSIIGPNLIILIDVEGAELKVLQGAIHILNKFKPIIIFEYNYVSNKIFTLENILEVLPVGYKLYSIKDGKELNNYSLAQWNIVAKFEY